MCHSSSMRLSQLRAAIFFKSFLVVVPTVLSLQSRPAQNSAGADGLCATMNTQFNRGCCIHVTFSGEVSAGKNFARPFGPLLFGLNSEQALAGWWIEVVPAGSDSLEVEYVWA